MHIDTILYHGTIKDVAELIPSSKGVFGQGIYTTDTETVATEYAKLRAEENRDSFVSVGNLHPVEKDLYIKYFEHKFGLRQNVVQSADIKGVIEKIFEKGGKHTKEQWQSYLQESFAHNAQDPRFNQIAVYFADKEIKESPKKKPIPAVYKLKVQGEFVDCNKTLAQNGYTEQNVDMKTICDIFSINYPVQNVDDFVENVMNNISAAVEEKEQPQLSCQLKMLSENYAVYKTQTPENEKKRLLDRLVKLSDPNVHNPEIGLKLPSEAPKITAGQMLSLAENALKTRFFEGDISENFPYAKMQKALKVDGVFLETGVFNKKNKYYIIHNPKVIRILEKKSQKTKWRWQPVSCAPNRHLLNR